MSKVNEHGAHESEIAGVSVDPGKEKTFPYIAPRQPSKATLSMMAAITVLVAPNAQILRHVDLGA